VDEFLSPGGLVLRGFYTDKWYGDWDTGWVGHEPTRKSNDFPPSTANLGMCGAIPPSSSTHQRHRPGALGLIHTASPAEPNRTDSAWKTNLRYEMEVFTLHTEPNRTEPDRAFSLADVCFYSPADNRFCCATDLTSGG